MLTDTDPEGDCVPLALIVTVDVTEGLSDLAGVALVQGVELLVLVEVTVPVAELEVDLERVGETVLQPVLVRLFEFEAVLVAIVLGVDVVLPVTEPVGETVVEAVCDTVTVVD